MMKFRYLRDTGTVLFEKYVIQPAIGLIIVSNFKKKTKRECVYSSGIFYWNCMNLKDVLKYLPDWSF